MKTENDLIPCDDELNRLKEFLTTVAAGRALSTEMRELKAFYTPTEPHRWCDSCGEYLRPVMAGTCNVCGTNHH